MILPAMRPTDGSGGLRTGRVGDPGSVSHHHPPGVARALQRVQSWGPVLLPGLGTLGIKTPSLVAVGFKGRPTQRARLRAGNEASAVAILLKVSLAKCLTTLTRALTLSYLPVCLWFAYNMHDLLYLN